MNTPTKGASHQKKTQPRIVWILYTESGRLFSWFSSHEMASSGLDALGAGTIARKQVEAGFNGF